MPVINDYSSLITSQYKNSPKFNKWLETLLTPLVDTQNFAQNLFIAFDIDNSIGVQLDIIGELVHVSRVLPFQPKDGLSPILNDDDYRFLLRAQIIRNNWGGTTEDLYNRWQQLVPDIYLSIRDNQDMSFNVIFIGKLSDIQKQMIENDMIIPRPGGVLINFNYTQPPIFTFDQAIGYFQGFDIGKWLELER